MTQYGEEEIRQTDEQNVEHVTRLKFDAGKVVSERHSYIVRHKVDTDQQELAEFVKFQREAKGNPHFTFTRETRGNSRYVVREYVD
jgi:hypothetical protein